MVDFPLDMTWGRNIWKITRFQRKRIGDYRMKCAQTKFQKVCMRQRTPDTTVGNEDNIAHNGKELGKLGGNLLEKKTPRPMS